MNALLTYVSESDLRVFRRVRSWTPPGWLVLWMVAATRFGDGWGWMDRFSFPSGHTMTAFAIATVLARQLPALAPLAGVLAVSVATSRVLLGLHYISDVLAGAALGALIGGLAATLLPA